MMIWLTQWLCPQRHCAFVLAWDEAGSTKEEVEEKGEQLFQEGAVGRYCFLCNSRDLNPEHSRSIFQTMAEAYPWLAMLQEANLRTRDFLNPN